MTQGNPAISLMGRTKLITVKQITARITAIVMLVLLGGCKEPATLTLADGEQQELSNYRGQWLVVNYFAEWCAPCLREMPLLNELADKEQPAVLAISFDALPPQALQDLSERYQMTMPVVAKLDGPWPFDSPRVLPTTFILDPKGKLVASHQGELKAEHLVDWQDKYWGKKQP